LDVKIFITSTPEFADELFVDFDLVLLGHISEKKLFGVSSFRRKTNLFTLIYVTFLTNGQGTKDKYSYVPLASELCLCR
jgi:hypothetical protein